MFKKYIFGLIVSVIMMVGWVGAAQAAPLSDTSPVFEGYVEMPWSSLEGTPWVSMPGYGDGQLFYPVNGIMPISGATQFRVSIVINAGSTQTYMVQDTSSITASRSFQMVRFISTYKLSDPVNFANDAMFIEEYTYMENQEDGTEVQILNGNGATVSYAFPPAMPASGGFSKQTGVKGPSLSSNSPDLEGAILNDNMGEYEYFQIVRNAPTFGNKQYPAGTYDVYFALTYENQRLEIGLLQNIWDSITGLPKAIIDGFSSLLQTLFVPGEDFISTKVQGLSDTLEEHLGFLSLPFTAINDVLQHANDWSGAGSAVFNLPAASLNLPGDQVVQIWPATQIDLQDSLDGFPDLLTWFRLSANFVLLVALAQRAIHLWHHYFGEEVPDLLGMPADHVDESGAVVQSLASRNVDVDMDLDIGDLEDDFVYQRTKLPSGYSVDDWYEEVDV